MNSEAHILRWTLTDRILGKEMLPRILRIAALWFIAFAATGADSLEFLHITDTHVINLGGMHPGIAAQRKMYEPAATGLANFLKSLEAGPPDFLLITGDLIDGFMFENAAGRATAGQIEFFRKTMRNSPVPVYLTLGNHDVQRYAATLGVDKPAGEESAAPEARAAWRAADTGFSGGTYYSVRKKVGGTTYRFLMLDDGSDKDKVFAATQLSWLARQVAESNGDRLIVAMHIPFELTPYTKSIKEVLRRATNLVLVLAGHRHSDAIEEVEFDDHRVIQVRTAIFALNAANFRSIRLFEDRIEIGATGKRSWVERTVALPPLAAAAGH